MFPKTWERTVEATCPECGYVMHTQEKHRCNGYIYELWFRIYALPEGEEDNEVSEATGRSRS